MKFKRKKKWKSNKIQRRLRRPKCNIKGKVKKLTAYKVHVFLKVKTKNKISVP